MKTRQTILVSHVLCPYVQRAAIVLHEKNVAFERRDVDLGNKPDWFLAVSPLGKTPVLLVDGVPLFESAVICEYLDETLSPRLHPAEPLQRARQRAWMEFGSAMLNTIAGFYAARDEESLEARRRELLQQLRQLEAQLDPQGPYFSGESFGMVDAVFGPVFRYFDVFDSVGQGGWTDGLARVSRWRDALAQRPSVRRAAAPDYPQRLARFLRARGSALSRRIAQLQPAASGSVK